MKIETCEFPDALLYDVDAGTWVRKDDTDYTIGVTPVLAWLSGGFTSISIKDTGSVIGIGKGLGSIEGPRHFDLMRAPFDCTIKEVNSRLSDPSLASKDSFGAGWIALLRRTGETTRLSTLQEASGLLGALIRRLGVRCFSRFPDLEMYEIQTECSAVIVKLNEIMSKSRSGTVVHLVSDDPTSDIEMVRWGDMSGNKVVESRNEGALHHFIVEKS